MEKRTFYKIIAVLVIAILPSLPAFAEGDRFVTITKAKGDVMMRAGGNEAWIPAEKGMILKEMDELKTGDGSKVEIQLDEKGETGKVQLKSDGLMRLTKMLKDMKTDKKQTLFDLARGKLTVKAAKLKEEEKFEIRTPTNVAGVRGTVFEVSVE